MTPYERIKKRCAEDPEYRKEYLAMRAGINQRARDRAKAKRVAEEIERENRQEEARRIAAVRAANEQKYSPKQPDNERKFERAKPGRLLALCGWRGF